MIIDGAIKPKLLSAGVSNAVFVITLIIQPQFLTIITEEF